MGRKTCCVKDQGLNKGAWSGEEDRVLVEYIKAHGEGRWGRLPVKAGLNRCGKSCRLRWLNYLKPGIKRGNISPDEEDLIIRLHKLLGNRWSLIAGRLPGRTDNEVKNYWNSNLSKRTRNGENGNLKAPKLHLSRDKTNLKVQESNNTAENHHNGIQPPPPSPEKEPPSSLAAFWAATLKCAEVDINPQLLIRQDDPLNGAISTKYEIIEAENNNNAIIGLLLSDDMAENPAIDLGFDFGDVSVKHENVDAENNNEATIGLISTDEVAENPTMDFILDFGDVPMKYGNLDAENNNEATVGSLSTDDVAENPDVDIGFDLGDISLSNLLNDELWIGNNPPSIPSMHHRDDDVAPGYVIQPLSSLFIFDSEYENWQSQLLNF